MFNLIDLFKLLDISELYLLAKSLRRYGLELQLLELQQFVCDNFEPIHSWYLDKEIESVSTEPLTIGAVVYLSRVQLELLEVFAVMPIVVFTKLYKTIKATKQYSSVEKSTMTKLYKSYLCLNNRNRRALVGWKKVN